jgi:hypothetical protein
MTPRALRILFLAGGIAVAALLLEWLVDPSHIGFDAAAYYLAAGDLLDGRLPYREDVSGAIVNYAGEGVYRYPPLFAVLFLPMAGLPFAITALLWCAALAALYTGVVALVAREAGPARWPWWLPALVVVGPLTDWTLGFGNASVLLLVALLGADLADRRGRSGIAGALVAGAVFVKLTPLLLLVYYAARGRWTTVQATLLGLAALLIGSLLLPGLREATLAYPEILTRTLTGGEGSHPAHSGLAWLLVRLGLDAALVRLVAIGVVVASIGVTIVVASRLTPLASWAIALLIAFFAAPALWPQSGLLLPLVTARLIPALPATPMRALALGAATVTWAAVALLPDPGKPFALWGGAAILALTAFAVHRAASRG